LESLDQEGQKYLIESKTLANKKQLQGELAIKNWTNS
jgi:hypothetical protein